MKDKSGYEFLLIAIFLAVGGYGLATLPLGCDSAGAQAVWRDTIWPDTVAHRNIEDYYQASNPYIMADSTDTLITARRSVVMDRYIKAAVLGLPIKMTKLDAAALGRWAYERSTVADTAQRLQTIEAAIREGMK